MLAPDSASQADAPGSRVKPLLALIACALVLQFIFLFEARVASDYGMAVNGWRAAIRQVFEPVERITGPIPRDVGDSPNHRTAMFMCAHTTAFAVFGAAILLVMHRLRGSRAALWLILLAALLFRLTFVMSPPLLENSINRYVWDGVVTAMGINPYRYSPQEIVEARDPGKRMLNPEPQRTELLHLSVASHDDLRTAYHFKYVTYPSLRTIYPPLAQLLFGTAAVVSPGNQDVLKLFTILVDLATIVIVLLLLQRLGRDLNLCVIYAWSPLVVKEFSNSGHVDVLACFFVMTAMLYLVGKRPALAGAALAMGGLAKVWPVALVAVFWRRLGRVGIVVMAGFLIIGLTPQASEPDLRNQGFAAFARHWEANSSLQAVLGLAFKKIGLEASLPATAQSDTSAKPTRSPISRAVAIIIMGLVLLKLGNMPQDAPEDLIRCGLYGVGTVLVCAPVVLPWYVTWVTPFLALTPSLAFLVLTYTVHLWYAAKLLVPSGEWYFTVHETLRTLEYLPFFVLLYRELRAKKPEAPSPE